MPCVFFGRKVAVATTPSAPTTFNADGLLVENAAIKARLDRLEEIVFNSSWRPDGGAGEPPSKVRRIDHQDSAIPTPTSTVSSHSDPELAKKYRRDVEWLDAVGT